MTRSMLHLKLRDALAEPGCAICRLRDAAANRLLEAVLWESITDPDVRATIRQARGFCHAHFWDLVRHGASLGVAIIAEDILRNLVKEMADSSFQSHETFSLRRVREALNRSGSADVNAPLVYGLTPQGPCPACVERDKIESIYLETLGEDLIREEGLLASYSDSDGLCLPHFRLLISQLRKQAVYEALVRAQSDIWDRLAGQLREAIRKSDYRFQDEALGEEGSAWLRAIAALAGSRSGSV
jgi:hypothetical protein